MRIRSVVLSLVCGLLLVSVAAAQQPEQPSMEEMMQLMAKYSTPGEHHKHLEQFIGAWSTTSKFWPAPGAPPVESTGEAEHTAVLGGRFLHLTYKGVMMDTPFEGMGFIGYDNYQQKHVDFWIDNFGTLMLTGEGSCDQGGKTITMFTTFEDPVSQTRKTMKTIYTFGGDQYALEMYDTAPDGTEFKALEIVHTRK